MFLTLLALSFGASTGTYMQAMKRLLEQILTMARLDPENIEGGDFINLNTVINEIDDEFSGTAAAKSIRLSVTAAGHATTEGETTSFRALLRNIVDNALRYTPENGTVTIRAEELPEGSRVWITDSGPGIPVDIREKIFSRFYRGEHISEDTGTGLGLAIAKRAAERLGARLQIQDNPSGVGISFLIDFPRISR